MSPRRQGVAAIVFGAALVFALAYLDAAWESQIMTTSILIGPFFTAIFASTRATACVALFAVIAATLSGGYNANYGTSDYFVRLVVVGVGAVFSIAAARAMRRLAADQRRFELLRGAAELADSMQPVAGVVDRAGTLLVPAFADVCVIDVLHQERVERLGVVASGPVAKTIAARLRASGPGSPEEIGDERSHLRVPLRSRGRTVGTLGLLGVTRTYTPADLQLAQLLGAQIGLALDNAGLFAELESLQARLTAALDTLAEAVTIQNEAGRLIYANQAAAASFGFATVAELLATPPVEIAAQFESTLEDGSPLDLELLPGRLVSQGLEAEPLLVRSVDRRTGEERWRMLKATPVPAQPGEPRLAVNVIEDVTEVKRAELVSRFLAQASAVLASALDHEEALARVAELAVGRVADGCAITLLDDGGQPRTVATAGGPVDVPVEPVLHRGRSRMDGGRMAVALIASGRAIGAIAFARARAFIPADLELAEELGRRAGTAVEYARLYRERSHIAATLQRSLLPDALPTVPGMRLASLYRPAGQENLVGGDFYDAFPTPSGWMLLVGDVTGRGAEAAALTGQARHTLRTAGTLLGEPEAALEQLNQALAARAELTPCTVVIVHVAPDVRTATIHCAGHPPPLLVRAGDVRSVGHYGPMLGAWTESAWPCARIELRSGDVVVLYSDGVTDTVGEDERFGEARLLAALRDAADAGGAVRAIERALDTFQRGAQADDTAVLALDLPTA